jgi:hypothetical protein
MVYDLPAIDIPRQNICKRHTASSFINSLNQFSIHLKIGKRHTG